MLKLLPFSVRSCGCLMGMRYPRSYHTAKLLENTEGQTPFFSLSWTLSSTERRERWARRSIRQRRDQNLQPLVWPRSCGAREEQWVTEVCHPGEARPTARFWRIEATGVGQELSVGIWKANCHLLGKDGCPSFNASVCSQRLGRESLYQYSVGAWTVPRGSMVLPALPT